jgi:dTDP-4-dehydrorhamnose 3,5-epimerase
MQTIGASEILPGVWQLKSNLQCDERGFFRELYRESLLEELGFPTAFPQDNVSYSGRGVIRGLHYLSGEGQCKIVQVLLGHIQAVVLDIRPGSPTQGTYKSISLGTASPSILCIPTGYAFGFCVISADALVHYKVSTEYDPSSGRRIYPFDFTLGIPWETDRPKLSKEDLTAPSWAEYLSSVSSVGSPSLHEPL